MCGVIAIATISATDMRIVRAYAEPHFTRKEGGLAVRDMAWIASHFMGREYDEVHMFQGHKTRPDEDVSIEEASKRIRLGIITTALTPYASGHAMPVVEGYPFNKCGFGQERAHFYLAWKPKRGEIARVINRWSR
jgi:hypothetical protein